MLRLYRTRKRGVPDSDQPVDSNPGGGEEGGENVRVTSEGEVRVTSEGEERVIA